MKFSIQILLILTFFSCSKQIKEKKYISKEIEIDLPINWTITDKDSFGNSRYFAVEKNGLNSSGLVTISFTKDEYEIEEWINLNIENFKSNSILKKANVTFGDIEKNKFQNINALSADYSMKLLGTEHKGTIYSFSKNGKIFAFVQQGANEDNIENIEDFNYLKSNIVIK